ncbi:PTS sugar transporter [Georgenia subflava]|uniref:PTS sugar transporter n=1 Tax=Georgenia subflava TaxID=1622177 RepID=UPI00186B3FA4|nr:PTS sugar transporter [Georgenia subflava]
MAENPAPEHDRSTRATHDGAPRRLAVVGSSGGNLYSHGGDDPVAMVEQIRRQAAAAGFEVTAVQLVAAAASLDAARPDTTATLYTLVGDTLTVAATGTLAEVDEVAERYDVELATRVGDGEIDALVLVSADPLGVNARTVRAAVTAGLPAAGTGGSSIAAAQALGLHLVAASGTTGSTSTTRAVSYVAGLARHFKVRYRPVLGSTTTDDDGGSPWRRISVRGIMVGSLPAFIALALILALGKVPFLAALAPVFDALIASLPVVVAAVAARRVSGLGEVGLVAGVVAGVLSTSGGIIGGLAGGILAGAAVTYLLRWTLAHRFPVTTANIVAGGLSGLLGGLVVFLLLAPVTNALGEGVKNVIDALVAFNPLLAGAVAGLVMWPAIMGGVYHAAILPLVLLEMSEKGHSFFGAVDMVSLVMVSLGITLANVVRPRTSGERALAASGAAVNFGFGTFVEASYPFMFADRKVFAVAIGSATLGGLVVGATGAEATAYLPAVVAPFVATDTVGMVLSMLVGAVVPFVSVLLINVRATRTARTAGSAARAAAQAR